jgi:hypothetical protein
VGHEDGRTDLPGVSTGAGMDFHTGSVLRLDLDRLPATVEHRRDDR